MTVNAVAASADPAWVGAMQGVLQGLVEEVRKLALRPVEGGGVRPGADRGLYPGNCFACGEYGHTRARCPTGGPWKRGKQGGAPVEAGGGAGGEVSSQGEGEGSASAGH